MFLVAKHATLHAPISVIWVIANNLAQFSRQMFGVYPLYKLLPDAMLAVFLMAGFRDYLGLVGHRYFFVTQS
jgi:hypothetical protein